jgi:hypothetical protein
MTSAQISRIRAIAGVVFLDSKVRKVGIPGSARLRCARGSRREPNEVPTPSIKWPTEFLEAEPPEDATISLTADAESAGTVFKVMALRLCADLGMPDDRDGISRGTVWVPATAAEDA